MTISLAKRRSKALTLMMALFIAANIGLPHLFHLFPGGGIMFLPIYFFTAFAAVSYGKGCGIITAIMSPLTGYMLFGMPAIPLLPDMILKGVILSVMLAAMVEKARTIIWKIISVPMAIAIAWLVSGMLELTVRSYNLAFQDFFTGVPGLLLMTVGGWIALFYKKRIAN